MPLPTAQDQLTSLTDYIAVWVESFLIAKKSENLSPYSIRFYRRNLRVFFDYCDSKSVKTISQITPSFLREYFLYLGELHNPGGVRGFYASVRAFLSWYWSEADPGQPNPIAKVRAPKVSGEPLEPVDIQHVYGMIDTCKDDLLGRRDKAIMLFLLDTGVRARQLLSISLADVNPMTGEVVVRKGKGGKPRTVYLGSRSRRALRAYLRERTEETALWLTDDGDALTYTGLKMMMRRRAKYAGVPVPQIHAFRRWFALTCLRNGMDVYSLSHLMGHSGIEILRRYLKQADTDLLEAHRRASPVDGFLE